MNTKNNLHNALKGAFENYKEPLNEAQWERLEGAITKRKKRRFFPFFLLFMVICFTAGSTYFLTLNYGVKNTSLSVYPTKQDKLTINTNKNNIDKNKNVSIISSQINSTNSKVIGSAKVIPSGEVSYFKTTKYYLNKNSNKNQRYLPSEIKEDEPKAENTEAIKDKVVDISTKEDKFEEAEGSVKKMEVEDIASKNKDSVILVNKKDKDKDIILPPPPHPAKFAFTLAAGVSKMNIKVVGIENGIALHKDTRKIFEESNKNLKTDFINLGFDWNILPSFKIGVNTGIQYLRVTTPVNIEYSLTQIPFWDKSHTQIEGYVTDTIPLKFNSSATNYTTYITIPLRFNYSIPVNSKNEILVTAGINLSTLAAAKGQSLIINNEPGVKSLNTNMYRRFNTGFTSGFQYNFRVKDTWWIGIESLYQLNSLKYKTGDGGIKNRLDGYMINAIIKYKI
ncbi:MAG: hypothetical protein ACKVQB_11995 [Bacteroidia bacterium]